MSKRYDAATPTPIYEVGWGYRGHPTPEEKGAALRLMLEQYGDDQALWLEPPQIRYQHIDKAQPSLWGRGPLEVPSECFWAVYGILKSEPDKPWKPEGVRLPMFEDMEGFGK